MAIVAEVADRDRRTIFGHPIGLFVLAATEMWERFSFYGMLALLILYLNRYLIPRIDQGSSVLGFGLLRSGLESLYGRLDIQPLSSQIFGLYAGLVYLTPFFGGLIADRLLGRRATIVIGGSLMAIGHFLIAMESMFLVALLFLIAGNGCFKPNISSQIGTLYPPGDPRLDRAFTIFYMSINLGALFSPLVCGTLGQHYGWHYGFAAAGVGMLIGLAIYLSAGRLIQPEAGDRRRCLQASANAPQTVERTTGGRAIAGLAVLAILNIVFWAAYGQQANTLQLLADTDVDWHVLGWVLPSSWFQTINPAFILILAPLFQIFWKWQAGRHAEPWSAAKMGIGCLLLGLSFLVLIVPLGTGAGPTVPFSFLWLVLCVCILTSGELYLSPIGLSLVNKVAAPGQVGMVMGLWFLSTFFGGTLSGTLGTFYARMPHGMFLLLLAGLAIMAGIAILTLQRPLRRAIESHPGD